MKIGIIGELTRFDELKQTLTSGHELKLLSELPSPGNLPDILFHLDFDSGTNPIEPLIVLAAQIPVVLSAASLELKQICSGKYLPLNLVGMNCIPGFINRPIKEISFHDENQKALITQLEDSLGWRIAPVKDRVGMVTPRILFMIINEAYFTLQEGTASRGDIDTGMKLGTNYPMGPFEWADLIGLKQIVNMLDALYLDTHDERYKVCSLLRSSAY